MALFGTKKKKETKDAAPVKVVKAAKSTSAVKAAKKTESVVAIRDSVTSVFIKNEILRPRITEKSGIANESLNVYTFEVEKLATKHSIAKAIKGLYKVTPLKIHTINLPAKRVFVRGRFGSKSAVKKALVYLKKGDKIEIA